MFQQKSAVIWQNPLTPTTLKIRFFAFFLNVTPMSFLRANIEFVFLTDFELSMVAKPIY